MGQMIIDGCTLVHEDDSLLVNSGMTVSNTNAL